MARKKNKTIECSQFLHLYNTGVVIDYYKADLLYFSQLMQYRRDRFTLKVVARLLGWANAVLGRMLNRRDGEVRQKAEQIIKEQEQTNLNN